MKILIFDNNHNDLDYFSAIVKKIPLNIELHTVFEYELGTQLFENNIYDIVFINNSVETGKSLLLYALNSNSSHRIITISNFHTCTHNTVCNFCKNKYNNERIFKPITQSDILLVLTNKNITQSHSTNNLLMNLRQIEKLTQESYPYYKLDMETMTFTDTVRKPYNRGFFLIVEALNDTGINYKVDENANIQIIV